MTLKLAKPTGAKIVFRKELPVDADAAAYIAAVEAADGQALESGVKFAITNFVLCCKQDGIWSAIKASCILAGARTLSGALVPLVGTAPTNFNFVAGDYSRKTGLVGNGSTKYLNSNRAANADPQNNCHLSVFVATAGNAGTAYIGGSINFSKRIISDSVRLNSNTSFSLSAISLGLVASSRAASNTYLIRNAGATLTSTAVETSSAPGGTLMPVFATSNSGSIGAHTNARLAFYSIGESLDLALLDARVTDLINAFGAVIP